MTFDIVVIGGGPNGLATAAYLAKSGLRVLVLEKRFELGGGLCTEEVVFPGFLSNTHAIYFMMVDYAPVYHDFALEKYNVRHIFPPLQAAMPFSDGRCLCLYTDVEKTCQSIEAFSRADARAYRDFYASIKRVVDEFVAPATYFPPKPSLELMVHLQSLEGELGKEILEYSEKTPRQIIEDVFENEQVRAMMMYLACRWGLEYDAHAMGFLVPLYIYVATRTRLVAGGSHGTAQGLIKVLIENGGMTLTSQQIKRIIVENGAAKGVELANGTKIMADKAVVSSIDPPQTFLQLIDQKQLDGEFIEKIKLWEWEAMSLLTVNLALQEAPAFRAAPANPDINRALFYILGYETSADVRNHLDAVGKGKLLPQAGFGVCFPTLHDPGQAPPGKHVGVISQFAPYALDGDAENWWRRRDQSAELCLATLGKYAPNVNKDNIIWRPYVSTPLDMENKFSDMAQGSFKQGHYSPFQLGYMRPNEDCSSTRTPVKNLYVCGASVYPGGCVIWGPGYLAANAVADDLGIKKWWQEPQIVTVARQKGLL